MQRSSRSVMEINVGALRGGKGAEVIHTSMTLATLRKKATSALADNSPNPILETADHENSCLSAVYATRKLTSAQTGA